MNNTFSFSRFGKFFQYDLRRWISSYGVSLLVFCIMPLVLYVLVPLFSLVFGEGWHSSDIVARGIVMGISVFLVFLTYPSKVYGFLTEKKAGSAYLMIPASTFEKFVSMMINTLLVVPALFLIVYFSLDSLLCALDPRCGEPLFSSLSELLNDFIHLGDKADNMFTINPVYLYVNFAINILYYLLGALIFKKNKVVYPILIMFGLQIVFSLLAGMLINAGLIDEEMIEKFAESFLTGDNLGAWITTFNVVAAMINIIITVGFSVAIYIRLKTIKH